MATFTRDYAVAGAFDDVLFTAHAGEAYLMAAYGSFFGKDHAELAYLTSVGPTTFYFDVASGSRAFPFTSNCTFDASVDYYAVFANVTVYDTAELSTKLCDLSAGSALHRDTASISGYTISGGFGISGPATFKVELNVFGAQCGGAKSGYIRVPETQVFGSTSWVVPIIAIIGPH